MGMTIKVPVKDLKKEDKCNVIREKLKSDPNNAYTKLGLMVECFNVKKETLHGKSFSDWPKGLPTLYTQIRLCLEKMIKEGVVKSVKQGKAHLYWWVVK